MNKLKIDEDTIVHCLTKDIAKHVLRIADKYGYTWQGGESLNRMTCWDIYKEKTCYSFMDNGQVAFCATVEYFNDHNYKIISAEEFINLHMAPKDILLNAIKKCEGSNYVIVVKYLNEENYIAINNSLLISTECNNYNRIDELDENLLYSPVVSNIEEIWKVHAGDNLNSFDEKQAELIWKREEIKEVTLKEIADKFGVSVESIRVV